MVAPIALPTNPLNVAAKDLTDAQITMAYELIRKHSITDPTFASAVLTNLAINFQTMKSS